MSTILPDIRPRFSEIEELAERIRVIHPEERDWPLFGKHVDVQVEYIPSEDYFVPSPLDKKKLSWKPF